MHNRLKKYRDEYGWSQQKLADELGVSRQTIISLEKARFDPSLPLAFRLAAVFQRQIEDHFFPDFDTAPK